MPVKSLLFLLNDVRKRFSCAASATNCKSIKSDVHSSRIKLESASELSASPIVTSIEIKYRGDSLTSEGAVDRGRDCQPDELGAATDGIGLVEEKTSHDRLRDKGDHQRRGELQSRLRQKLSQKRAQVINFEKLVSCPSIELLYINMTQSTILSSLSAATYCLMFAILLIFASQTGSATKETSSAPLSLPINSPSTLRQQGATFGGRNDESTKAGSTLGLGMGAGGALSSIDWPKIGSQLVKQLASGPGVQARDRWINLQVTGDNTRHQYRPRVFSSLRAPGSRLAQQRPGTSSSSVLGGGSGGGGLGGQQNRLNGVWNEFRERLGARNTMRVHNAFRDLAWRILSHFAMPTPAIYELRRQHFYPIEEDAMNDLLFNRNTSKTIRSKRHLKSGHAHLDAQSKSKTMKSTTQDAKKKLHNNGHRVSRRYDDEDDEDR